MKIKLSRIAEPFHLQAENETGQTVSFDAAESIGGSGKGMRPMQVLASSLAACASIDVLSILRKQKVVLEFYEVEVEAIRKEEEVPAVFESIHLNFKFKGVGLDQFERAVRLSVEKYCSVSRMLENRVKITSSIKLIK